MLPSVQAFTALDPGVFRRFHGAYHPRIWVHVVEQNGSVDEALVRNLSAQRPESGRQLTGIVLQGTSAARFRDSTVCFARGGTGLTCEGRGLFLSRAEARDNESSLSFNVDCDATYFGLARSPEPAVIAVRNVPRLIAKVRKLVSAIDSAWAHPAQSAAMATCLADLLALLAAEGLTVPRLTAADLAIDVASEVARTSRALDRALSRTDEMPMLVDLEASTGLSIRTVQRLIPQVLATWGHVGGAQDDFRSLRLRVLLMRACLIMSHPAATTERAATLLGFSSPNALCRAFMKRGLPSPGSVRARLRQLAC